ncbi:MAG: acyl carrier protein [Bacteroidales bacterium]|nr:acyl carrier protein [Bacteroidales bacterium]
MEKTEILHKVEEVFRDVLDNEEITLAEITTANDIDEWDSLTHVELVRAVEKAFGIRFTSAEILAWKNVGEMVASVARHKA